MMRYDLPIREQQSKRLQRLWQSHDLRSFPPSCGSSIQFQPLQPLQLTDRLEQFCTQTSLSRPYQTLQILEMLKSR